MLKLLRRMFPKAKPQMRVVLEGYPEWTSKNAEDLAAFLTSNTGQTLTRRIRSQVCGTLLDPNLTEDNRSLARALTLVLEGLESSADVKAWKDLEEETLDEHEKGYRYFQVEVEDAE